MSELRRKLVIVGDGACGKTCLLIVFSKVSCASAHSQHAYPPASIASAHDHLQMGRKARLRFSIGIPCSIHRSHPLTTPLSLSLFLFDLH